MTFSIIIPVHNVERYLEQCVRSVLGQTFGDFEVILVDDGSTDSSGKLCDTFASRDARVHVIHQPNAGLSAARNTGINHASGDYILFMDGDDFWLDESFLERISSILRQHPVDVVEFDAIKFIDGEQPVVHEDDHKGRPSMEVCLAMQKDREALFCHLIQHNAIVGSACNKIVNKRLFLNGALRFREGVTAEDIDWTARLMSSACTWLCHNAYIYAYRQRSGSISHSFSYLSAKQLAENIEYIAALQDQEPYMRAYLGVCVTNWLINVSTLSFAEQKRLYPYFKKLRPSLDIYVTRRAYIISKVLRLCGYYISLLMLRGAGWGVNVLRRCSKVKRNVCSTPKQKIGHE